MIIKIDDLAGPAIQALLQEHLDDMAKHSPPERIHALDLDAFCAPGITFWSGWENNVLAGCGALCELGPTHGEIKSMRTVATHRRRGVARQFLGHIIAEAKRRNYRRVSLETGSMAAFAPARQLYRSFGFARCPPFAHYALAPNSLCMTKTV